MAHYTHITTSVAVNCMPVVLTFGCRGHHGQEDEAQHLVRAEHCTRTSWRLGERRVPGRERGRGQAAARQTCRGRTDAMARRGRHFIRAGYKMGWRRGLGAGGGRDSCPVGERGRDRPPTVDHPPRVDGYAKRAGATHIPTPQLHPDEHTLKRGAWVCAAEIL